MHLHSVKRLGSPIVDINQCETHQLTGSDVHVEEVDVFAASGRRSSKPQTHSVILSLTHEKHKKEAINLTFNKTPSQKIYSNYAKKKKKSYCFQSEHVLKSYTLASPTIKKKKKNPASRNALLPGLQMCQAEWKRN